MKEKELIESLERTRDKARALRVELEASGVRVPFDEPKDAMIGPEGHRVPDIIETAGLWMAYHGQLLSLQGKPTSKGTTATRASTLQDVAGKTLTLTQRCLQARGRDINEEVKLCGRNANAATSAVRSDDTNLTLTQKCLKANGRDINEPVRIASGGDGGAEIETDE